MRVLLDTHILLWALTEDPKLPEDAKKIISDVNNEISVLCLRKQGVLEQSYLELKFVMLVSVFL